MSVIEKKLLEKGIELSSGSMPIANYVSVQRDGNTLYFSGSSALKDGKPVYQGKLGMEVSIEEGYEAARLAAINLISIMKREIGDLDKVEQIIKVMGFVASVEDFFSQPSVIDGASDLFVEIFGDKGRHARSAVGTNVLPMNLPLEIELIVKIKE